MLKDWTGNRKTMATTLGASNLSDRDRAEHDYYATPSKAGEDLIKVYPSINNVWECAVGEGSLSKGLGNIVVKESDLVLRNYECEQLDFLNSNYEHNGWIVTNPPYKYAKEFALKAIELASDGVAMFLRIQFLESQKRQELFKKYPPKYVYIYTKRCPQCALNGDFSKDTGNATTYAWFIWEKGSTSEPIIRWI